jgi:hypothetical protein
MTPAAPSRSEPLALAPSESAADEITLRGLCSKHVPTDAVAAIELEWDLQAYARRRLAELYGGAITDVKPNPQSGTPLFDRFIAAVTETQETHEMLFLLHGTYESKHRQHHAPRPARAPRLQHTLADQLSCHGVRLRARRGAHRHLRGAGADLRCGLPWGA